MSVAEGQEELTLTRDNFGFAQSLVLRYLLRQGRSEKNRQQVSLPTQRLPCLAPRNYLPPNAIHGTPRPPPNLRARQRLLEERVIRQRRASEKIDHTYHEF